MQGNHYSYANHEIGFPPVDDEKHGGIGDFLLLTLKIMKEMSFLIVDNERHGGIGASLLLTWETGKK